MNLDSVKQFLEDFEECVIATVNERAKPEAATVGLSCDDNFTFLIGTNKDTRKAANISQNNSVALVVGFSGPKTVQIEGVAEKVTRDTHQERIELHLDTVSGARSFDGEPGQTYYMIKPTWLRFTDYTQEDPIFETEDFS
ncbi:pyridoxamine 5'-phosphate oxidase family protein [Candidatus Saccharibacteria bacterium]|nr:pyridoxamine 5'-phosphate oxidase family protein [Candidatus Saccharibacteria bacterium]